MEAITVNLHLRYSDVDVDRWMVDRGGHQLMNTIMMFRC